jgi:hypothetical protein
MFDAIISTFFGGTALTLTEVNSIVIKKIAMKYFIIDLNN